MLDESHAYRGVFGAHVSAVLRRLLRLARGYGADPVVVLASATTGDPGLSAARLLGVTPEEVVAVTEDTAPRGRTTLVLWQPPELPGAASLLAAAAALRATPSDAAPGDAARTCRSSTSAATTRPSMRRPPRPGARRCRRWPSCSPTSSPAGARALAFTRSRRGAESVAAMARAHLDEVEPGLGARVAAYRGGYLPEERRELERALRSGELRALATTNALELGVDISGLDAVLIAGWPGTRVSLWQQAGRAGRAGADGLVTLVAREDPLDTYLVHHPEELVGVPVEATVFDPTNPYVLAPHLCAAAAERPLRSEDLPLFGPGTRELLDVLVDRGALRRRDSGWYWTHADPAAWLTDLRGTGGEPVRVVEEDTGRLLGTVDAASADAQVHEGAVYVHQGRTHVVQRLDLETSVALVRERDVDHRTWAHWVSTVDIREVLDERRAGPVTWGFGTVDTTTQVVSYTKRRLPDLANVGGEVLDLPPRTMRTTAVWWTAPLEVLQTALLDDGSAPGALHAAEHASIGLLPLLATCDRWDLGGLSTALHADTGCATVFVHDAYPGGAGFAERGFQLGERWLTATRDAIAACRCASRVPGVRPVAQVRQRQRPAGQGRGAAPAGRGAAAHLGSRAARRLARASLGLAPRPSRARPCRRRAGPGRGGRRPGAGAADAHGHHASAVHRAEDHHHVVAPGDRLGTGTSGVAVRQSPGGEHHPVRQRDRPRGRERSEVRGGPRSQRGGLRADQDGQHPRRGDQHGDHRKDEHGARPGVGRAAAHGSTQAVAAERTGRGPDVSQPPAAAAATVTSTHGGSRRTRTSAPGRTCPT